MKSRCSCQNNSNGLQRIAKRHGVYIHYVGYQFRVSIGLFSPFTVLVAIWVKVPFFPITIDLFAE
jgi:hypothetical protein